MEQENTDLSLKQSFGVGVCSLSLFTEMIRPLLHILLVSPDYLLRVKVKSPKHH